jgi:hypothetical protein
MTMKRASGFDGDDQRPVAQEKFQHDRLHEALDEVWRARPMTAKGRAWAKRILAG